MVVLGVVVAAAGSSVSWAASGSGCGSGVVVLKQAEGKEKMDKERRRCITAEDALRVTVTPDPRRRGDGSGGRALERTATAATTALTTRNHSALELSHAGSGAHHHIAAIVSGWLAGWPPKLWSQSQSLVRARRWMGLGYERALVVWFFGQWWWVGGRTGGWGICICIVSAWRTDGWINTRLEEGCPRVADPVTKDKDG